MVRLRALALAAIATVGAAWAQTTQTYSLGSREAGAAHNSRLTARNENCTQPLDIRFDFAPSPWLRPQGDNVVRGIPAGESRALPVVIDLTQAQPGTHTAQVDVVCENCRGLIFLNCRFDRQRLLLTVEATAPAPASLPAPPATTAPAPQSRPQPTSATPPAPARSPAATPPERQDVVSEPAPAPAPVEEAAATSPTVACDCGGAVALWQAAAAAGGALALIGLGWGAMSSAGASAARKALEEASRASEPERATSSDLALKALEKKLEHAEADAQRATDNLAALAQAQAQAMRALNAIGQAGDNASEADAWTTLAASAGHFVNEAAGRVVPDRGEGRLSRALETARGKYGDAASLFDASDQAGERARMDWLIAHGFSFSDADATAVLSEMGNWRTHNAMGDMIARLQQAIDARNRADAGVRALEAQILALEHG